MSFMLEESGMQLGPYEEDCVFHIEKNPIYTKDLKPYGCKICECILHRNGALLFIEAKTSCPKNPTEETDEAKKRKYHEYIDDIIVKMRHSMALYINILLSRFDAPDIPAEMRNGQVSQLEFKPVLIVKNAEKSWLIPLEDKLTKEFRAEMRIWKCKRFLVINEEIARRKHLISG